MKRFTPPMNSPRRKLFIRIFKSDVTLSVSLQIDFVCVRTACLIQLYVVLTLGFPRRIHLTDPKPMTKNQKISIA